MLSTELYSINGGQIPLYCMLSSSGELNGKSKIEVRDNSQEWKG